MSTKNQLKYYSSLLQKKYRREESKFIVEGYKLIKEAIESAFKCEIIFYTNHFLEIHEELINELENYKISLECIKAKEFEKLVDTQSPQEIVGIFHFKTDSKKKTNISIIVALENINDPGNFGTIIRSSDWFGISEIIVSSNCAEIFNPKVIRSSAGSVFHLNILETNNFVEELTLYKKNGYKIICADLNGKNLFDFNEANEKTILVFANEANGPTSELLAISNDIVTIPAKGKAESLNVANAASIILAHFTK